MIQCLVRQVMCLIKDKQCIFRLRQNGTTAKGKVCQHQVVVGHHDVGIIEVFSGVEEGTAVEIATVAIGTLTMVGGDLAPDVIGYLIRPMVAITVPLPGPVTGQHVFKIGPGAGFFLAGPIQQEQRHGIAVAVTLVMQASFETRQTQVAATTFGKGPGEIQFAVLFQIRKVFVDDLILQGNGRC